jgi:hypothetical protein
LEVTVGSSDEQTSLFALLLRVLLDYVSYDSLC